MGLLCALGFKDFMEYRLLPRPIPTNDAKISQAYEHMTEDPVPGAVLIFPSPCPIWSEPLMWNQSVHGRPVPWGLNDPMPKTFSIICWPRPWSRSREIEREVCLIFFPDRPGNFIAKFGSTRISIYCGTQRLYPRYKAEQVEQLLTALYGIPNLSTRRASCLSPCLERDENEWSRTKRRK